MNKLNWISNARIVSIGAISCIVGALIAIFRVFLTDHGFAVYGLGEPEPWLSFIFLLGGTGLLGFWILHSPSSNSTWAVALSSVIGSLYGTGIFQIGVGNPFGTLPILGVIIILSFYGLKTQTLGRQSVVILVLVALCLCSLLPYLVLVGSTVRSDSGLNIIMGFTAILS